MRRIFLLLIIVFAGGLVSCRSASARRRKELGIPRGKTTRPRRFSKKEAKILYLLAQVNFEQGEYARSLAYYRELIWRYEARYKPAGAEAHVAVGDCFAKLNRLEYAASAYDVAARLYPEASIPFVPYIRLGDCYMKLGRYSHAFGAYYDAERAYGDLATVHEIKKKMDKAKASFYKTHKSAYKTYFEPQDKPQEQD